MSETLTIHVATDEEWLADALELTATPAEITGAVGATTATGPAKPPADSPLVAQKKKADALRPLLPPDHYDEADAGEWDAVIKARTAVTLLLDKKGQSAADVAAAEKLVPVAQQAEQTAIAAIQTRLGLAATALRAQAQAARKPHDDSQAAEWAGVLAVCDSVDQALSNAILKRDDIAKARLAADKVPIAVAAAQAAIKQRLANEAALIEGAVAAFATPNPEAEGTEWQGVTDAVQAVRGELTPDALSNAKIAAAKQRQLLIPAAVTAANGVIQARLLQRRQEIIDKITPSRTAPASAIAGEWTVVTDACDAAQAALPPATKILTAADLLPAQPLVKRIPVAVALAKAAIQTHLQASADVQLLRLAPYAKPEPGAESAWTPLTEACQRVRAHLPPGQLTVAGIQAAKLEADGLAAIAATVYAAAWEAAKTKRRAETNEVMLGLDVDNKSKKAFIKFVTEDADVKALQALVGTKTAPGAMLAQDDLTSYRASKIALDQSFARVCGLLQKLAATINEKPATAVPQLLADAKLRLLAQAAYDQTRNAAQAELTAIAAVKADAGKPYKFRTYLPVQDKALKDIVADMTTLETDLTANLGDKGRDAWQNHDIVATMRDAATPYGQEQWDRALFVTNAWASTILGKRNPRQKAADDIAKLLAQYDGVAAPEPLYVLELARDALVKKLNSTTVLSIRTSLEGAGAPAAIWKKAFADAVAAQINTPISGEIWAGRIGAGKASKADKSMGWDNTGEVTATIAGKTKKTQTHITLYAADTSASHAGTAAAVVEQIIRTGVVGIHCTMEFYGKDNPDNPKVYRTLALKMPPGAAGVALQGAMGPLLTGYINDFADMVKPWLDRGGQTTREWAASETYRGKVEADIAALTPG